jgi:hypothetical protein
MVKHISIFQVSSTIKEIHMVYHRNYSKKNNLSVYSQIQFGIIQVLEELRNKLEEVKEVEKGK